MSVHRVTIEVEKPTRYAGPTVVGVIVDVPAGDPDYHQQWQAIVAAADECRSQHIKLAEGECVNAKVVTL